MILELSPHGIEAIADCDVDVLVGMVLGWITLHHDLLARDLEVDADMEQIAVTTPVGCLDDDAATHDAIEELLDHFSSLRAFVVVTPTQRTKHADRVRDVGLVAFAQQAVHVKQRSQGTNGVGAATEAKEVYFVAGLVIVHQEHISVANIGGETEAEGEAHRAPKPAPPRRQCAGRFHRAQPRMIVDDLIIVLVERLIELHNVGAIRRKMIRCAVAAKDNVARCFVFLHWSLVFPCDARFIVLLSIR